MRLLILGTILLSNVISAQSLEHVLSLVRDSSRTYKAEQARHRAKVAETQTLDRAYDWNLTVDAQNVYDNSEQNNRFSGDQRQQKAVEIQLKKQFKSGTQLQLGYSRNWQHTRFPAPFPPTTLPDGSLIPGQDPAAATVYNPAYFNTLNLTLVQPLWRNFMAKQTELKRQTMIKGSSIPRYNSLLRLQADQYRAESLYWAIVALNKRVDILRRLLNQAKEFSEQTKARVMQGRAEEVDQADAEARFLRYESSLLDLRLKRDDSIRQLAAMMRDNVDEQIVPATASLAKTTLALPYKNAEQAIEHARKSRLDLRLNSLQEELTQARIQEAKEEGAWDISFYASTEINGIETEPGDSLDKMQGAKNARNIIGLKLDIPLAGHSASTAKLAALRHERVAIEIERQRQISDTTKELEIAYLKLNGTDKKIALLDKQIASLRKKKNEEARKLLRARSERIAVIRYEMEVLSAKLDLIDALELKRSTEASIRYLIHGYSARKP